MYYHGAKGAILVYNIADPSTFERVKAYEQGSSFYIIYHDFI